MRSLLVKSASPKAAYRFGKRKRECLKAKHSLFVSELNLLLYKDELNTFLRNGR